MNYSLKLGRYFDIDVFVHWSFILVPAWVIYNGISTGLPLLSILVQVGLSFAIFFCVLLHEYGHALAARRFGVSTRDIVLLPIGGVARLESMPKEPFQELVIAVAGPAVNVVIALLLLPFVLLFPAEFTVSAEVSLGKVIQTMFVINIVLVVFNAIPAFPMDGGRVLRASLAFFLPHTQATILAARCGQLMSLMFFALGVFARTPGLFFIAIFVFWLAARELRVAQWQQQQEKGGPRVLPANLGPGWLRDEQRFADQRASYWKQRG